MSGRGIKLSRRSEWILFLVFVLCAAGLFTYVFLSEKQKPEPLGDPDAYRMSNAISVETEKYAKKTGLTSILLIGVDRDEKTEAAGMRNGGQADFLRLLVLDKKEKTLTQIQIDRDTMTPITVPSLFGGSSRKRTERISLSHGFGDGDAQSCELTMDAAEELLNGIHIDYYVSLTMNGIPVLNDLLGGVTVTVKDDLSYASERLVPGAVVTLTGNEAYSFLRSRMAVGGGTNSERMLRQQSYLQAAGELLKAKLQGSLSFGETLYEALRPYMVTNMPKGTLVNEAYAASGYEMGAFYSPDGVHEIDEDGFMMFTVDREALDRIVLDVFYDRI